MDYAFSLVKLETMSVEEFLQMDGDDGWLIGKNLIVCSECRANVFLRRGEKRTPHFAHTKFREENEGCTKRVGKYTPDKVKQMRAKQSKYRVGYFQQRFEDYLYLSLLDTIKESDLFYVNWAISADDESEPLIALEKLDESTYPKKIDHLRNISKAITRAMVQKGRQNKGSKVLGEAAEYWLTQNKALFQKAGPEKFRSILTEAFQAEGTKFESTGLKTELIDQLQGLKFSYREGEEVFAVEAIIHLLQKGAEPLVGAAMAAGMELFLSTELSRVWRKNAGIGVFEKNSYAMDVEFLINYLEDTANHPEATLTSAKLLRAWLDLYGEDAFEKKYSRQILDMEKKLMEYGAKYFPGWAGRGPKKGPSYPFFVETYSFISRLFKFINFATTAQSYYGDSAESPEEARRKAIDAERGFVYIAWAPYLKGIWEIELKKSGFKDCVKIGYSDDPDRRKNEISGNIGPPDSVEIIDVWPVMDMKEAEKIVHRKLNRFRLSPDRELFGLDVEESKIKVGEILEAALGVGSKKNTTSSGFG